MRWSTFAGVFAFGASLALAQGVAAAEDQPALPSDQPLTIQRITPAGSAVDPGRQIVIEFNRQVVPLGRMERTTAEIPITITPALVCQWRWITTRTLACNLDEKQQMQRATEYKLEIKPGNPFARRQHPFSVRGP